MKPARMGELVASATEGDELVAIGLGSCIGLAVLDRGRGVAGLAHVVLPLSTPDQGPPAKFADQVVPALIAEVVALGGRRGLLEAMIAGGARMFEFGGAMDIGARNDAATRAALADARVRIVAAATGGSTGRTMRVVVGPRTVVTVQEAGGTPTELGRRLVGAAA